MNRRSFLTLGAAAIAAPAVVRFESLMPLWVPKPERIVVWQGEMLFYNSRTWALYSVYDVLNVKPPEDVFVAGWGESPPLEVRVMECYDAEWSAFVERQSLA